VIIVTNKTIIIT